MIPFIALAMLLFISVCCEAVHSSSTTFPIVLIICGLVVWGISVAKRGLNHHRDVDE